jgi:competence protein ComEC
MGVAVGAVLRISQWVGEFGGSTVFVPAFGAGALALMASALVVAALMVSPLRLAAVVPAVLGLWLAATPKRFDVFVDREGAGAAVRGAAGRLVVTGRVSAFVAEQWLRADGDGRKPDDDGLRAGARCDQVGCVVEFAGGRAAALVSDRRAFAEDCRRAALIISRLPAPATCKPPLLLDRTFLAAHGATAIRVTPAGAEIVTSRTADRSRPWLERRLRDGRGRDATDAARRAARVPDEDPVPAEAAPQ